MTKIINMDIRKAREKLVHTAEMTGYPIICILDSDVEEIKSIAAELGVTDISVMTNSGLTYSNQGNIKRYDKVLLDANDIFIQDALNSYFYQGFGADVVTCAIDIPRN